MPAYAILDLKIFDKEQLQEYKNVAPEIIKKYKEKIIICGGNTNIIEGN